MANRSYLYTYHPGEEPEYRDFAEWNYDVPIAHFLLVGANPTPSKSAIWQVEQKIAIRGDAAQTRPLFLEFLDWLEAQLPDYFREPSNEAKAMLTRADRQGAGFHLELGEIYELTDLDLEGMERETVANAAAAAKLFDEVRRLVRTSGMTLKDATDKRLKTLADTWEDELGLDFSEVLYFHLGG